MKVTRCLSKWGSRGQTDTEEACRVAVCRGAAAGKQGQDTETLPPYPLSYTKFVPGIYVAQFPMKLFPGSWLKLAMQEEAFKVRTDPKPLQRRLLTQKHHSQNTVVTRPLRRQCSYTS